jgi:hypothetical protein
VILTPRLCLRVPGIALRPDLGAISACAFGSCAFTVGSPHHPTNQIGVLMSNIIGFLEQAGMNAALRHANRETLLQAMLEEEIEPTHQRVILQAQRSVLDDLTGARETMYCENQAIKPPKKKKAPAKKQPAKKPAKKAPAKRKK